MNKPFRRRIASLDKRINKLKAEKDQLVKAEQAVCKHLPEDIYYHTAYYRFSPNDEHRMCASCGLQEREGLFYKTLVTPTYYKVKEMTEEFWFATRLL